VFRNWEYLYKPRRGGKSKMGSSFSGRPKKKRLIEGAKGVCSNGTFIKKLKMLQERGSYAGEKV